MESAARAYAPYSGFRVGAALLLSDGITMVSGCNVENVSYGLTICAERAAVVQAVSLFGPTVRFAAAAVTNLNNAASPPCGACRQVLAEFMDPDAPVLFPGDEGAETRTMAELLPLSFRLEKAH